MKIFLDPMHLSFTPAGSVDAALFSPALDLLIDCEHTRDCPNLSDAHWIHMGLERVLHELPSGRAYLQLHGFRSECSPFRGNYFEALKSLRRLRLIAELNQHKVTG